MTLTIRHHVVPALAASGVLVALATSTPAQALTLPEDGPPRLVPAGETTTWSSRAYERAIAECMEARGFEYEPYLFRVRSTPMETDGGGEVFAMEFLGGGDDPNEAIVAGLPVAERIAYHHALNGAGSPLDAQGYPTGRSVSVSDGSCGGQAG